MNNYSVIFEDENIENEQQKANIIGRFNRDKYNFNIQKYSLENQKQELREKQIWDVTYKAEDYDEDNDTSEEEDEEPYDEDIATSQETSVQKNKTAAEKIAEELLNPNKGFKFFIEKEQKFLEKLEKRKQKIKEEQERIKNLSGEDAKDKENT